MRKIKRAVLTTASTLALASPALADSPADKPNARESEQATAQQRQKAMNERREAVRQLPAEQRAAIREAHQKPMSAEQRAEHRRQMKPRGQKSGPHAMGNGRQGKKRGSGTGG